MRKNWRNGWVSLFYVLIENSFLKFVQIGFAIKDCSSKVRSKHSTNTVLCLLRNLLEQSLALITMFTAKFTWTVFSFNYKRHLFVFKVGRKVFGTNFVNNESHFSHLNGFSVSCLELIYLFIKVAPCFGKSDSKMCIENWNVLIRSWINFSCFSRSDIFLNSMSKISHGHFWVSHFYQQILQNCLLAWHFTIAHL